MSNWESRPLRYSRWWISASEDETIAVSSLARNPARIGLSIKLPDGGDFSWLDTDNDGMLTFGTDGVDLNGDGKISPNEILRYIEIRDDTYGMLGGDTKKYNPDLDFLYTDVNGNKRRDFGPKGGFKESDASYGEQLFILRAGVLDVRV